MTPPRAPRGLRRGRKVRNGSQRRETQGSPRFLGVRYSSLVQDSPFQPRGVGGHLSVGIEPAALLGAHLWCHGPRCVRHARGWYAYGVRTVRASPEASCPAPPVRTARRRLVRVACTYSTEAPGRTCQHGRSPTPKRSPPKARMKRSSSAGAITESPRSRLTANGAVPPS